MKTFLLLVYFFVLHGYREFVAAVPNENPTMENHMNSPAGERINNNEVGENEENITDSITPLQNQVGGHFGTFMKDSRGFILKQIDNQKEIDFYEILRDTSIPELKELKLLVPAYYGTDVMKIDGENEDATYIRIEDLTKDFVLPCVMDIKLGKQTWEPGVPYSKVISARPNFPAEMREVLEFLIPGFQFFDVANELKFEKRDREFGRLMSLEQGVESLFIFVNGKLGLEFGVVDDILEQLHKIRIWFEHQTQYHFYGSSILITYDAQTLANGENPEVRVRMIDFAHTIRNSFRDGRDVNYANALEKLIALFENFLPENDTQENNNLTLPNDLKRAEPQVIGHIFKRGGRKSYDVLQDSEKRLLVPEASPGEIVFYNFLETIHETVLEELKEYISVYFGVKDIEIDEKVVKFLHVENIIRDFQIPCIMDVKIGRVQRPSWEPPETVAEQLRYFLTKRRWGFGIRTYAYHNVTNQTFVRQGKEFGYRMLSREAIQTMYNFVNGKLGIDCGLVENILEQLRKIRSWFERQRFFHFFDTSVLLTYDAKNLETALSKVEGSTLKEDRNEQRICQGLQVPVRVCTFNFDKVAPAEEDKEDENYLFGIRNLIFILENLPELYSETLNGSI